VAINAKIDLQTAYGEQLIEDLSGGNDALITQALGFADGIANAALRQAGFSLPLPSIPGDLKNFHLQLAYYDLMGVRATEKAIYDYTDARTWFRDLAMSKITIDIDPGIAPVDSAASAVSKPSAVFSDANLSAF
jgi:phage gp36-like protein